MPESLPTAEHSLCSLFESGPAARCRRCRLRDETPRPGLPNVGICYNRSGLRSRGLFGDLMSDTQPLVVGVPAEVREGETRVALVPQSVGRLAKLGCKVAVQTGAGQSAGFPDDVYQSAGARLLQRAELLSQSDLILGVDLPWVRSDEDVSVLREGQVLVGSCDPLWEPEKFRPLAECGVTCFALELLPRITRAQSMDILSSMATCAGYKAVILAASHSVRLFPMLMTAAGTIKPARVFIVGAGVAGLQAIATARRLGAVVSAYDVRPAVKEQVESLGARFVEMDLDAGDAEQAGGYAKEMDEEFYRRQREMMSRVVAESDVVITTAAIPGKPSPLLVTTEMVDGMQPGSVIVDLAAERGGNCEVTLCDAVVEHNGVTVLGPSNLPATVPLNASEMYSRNVTNFLATLVADGKLQVDRNDEIIANTLVTWNGQIIHPRLRSMLELPPLDPPAAPEPPPAADGGTYDKTTEKRIPLAE